MTHEDKTDRGKKAMRKICLIMLMSLCLISVSCAEGIELPDKLPQEYLVGMQGGGTVEKIQYPSKDYSGDQAEVTKHAVVYLPAGYDDTQQYDLLVLCHGVGGYENEWGFLNPFCIGRNVIDHLIENQEIRPLIVVMPNGRSTAKYNDTSMNNAYSFYTFGKELRNDLLPWIDEHYATYGTREHRAMAGLSMGGMQTINIGLCECLDLFSAFGAFSAAPTSYTASQIAEELKQFEDCPIRFFYSICGTEDGVAYSPASQAAKNLPDFTDQVNESNWLWQECAGGHDFNIWNLGLFNFLRLLETVK